MVLRTEEVKPKRNQKTKYHQKKADFCHIENIVVMRVEILLQGLTSDLSFTIMGERKVTLLRMEVIMANNTKERILAAALEMFSQNG